MKDDWKERGLKLEVKFHKEPLQKLKKQNQNRIRKEEWYTW